MRAAPSSPPTVFSSVCMWQLCGSVAVAGQSTAWGVKVECRTFADLSAQLFRVYNLARMDTLGMGGLHGHLLCVHPVCWLLCLHVAYCVACVSKSRHVCLFLHCFRASVVVVLSAVVGGLHHVRPQRQLCSASCGRTYLHGRRQACEGIIVCNQTASKCSARFEFGDCR